MSDTTKEPELIVPKNAPKADPEPAKTEEPKPAPKKNAPADTTSVTVKAHLPHPTTGELIRHGETADIPHVDAAAWVANGLATINEG